MADAVTTHYCNDSSTAEWLREMRTIDGDIQPDSHDWVSNLKPKQEQTEHEGNCDD